MKVGIKKDKEKASSLLEMAKTTYERLKETNINKYPTNTFKDYYDIIHSLMEALASLKGYKMKGEGAHKELIDYVCEEFGFEEGSRLFLQEMRNYRNRISYEGFMIKENYVSQNEEKIEDIVHRLFKHLEDDL